MPHCPACKSNSTLLLADHYETQVKVPGADSRALAPLAPPLRRSILSGTLCITLFWMALLLPGFVHANRAMAVAFTFGLAGGVAMIVWLRARKADRARMATYQKAMICLECGHRF